MGILEAMTRPREVRPKALLTAGLIGALVFAYLWIAGYDGSLLGLAFLLFTMTAAAAYHRDPHGGKRSARRGGLVGGLTMLVWVPWVVCQSSYERRGVAFPNSPGEVLRLGVALVLFGLFGVGVGMMVGVIGGWVIRSVGTRVSTTVGRGKAKGNGPAATGLEWP